MIFIRIRINGYLKNITDNETFNFEEKGIKNKNKITFVNDGVRTSIKYTDSEVMLVREGNDFINTFVFRTHNSSCNYLLKENNCDVDIEIETLMFDVCSNNIFIKYVIVDSGIQYEYKLEMSDVL